MTILITGGSGSGKSALAEKIIHTLCPTKKIYLATMLCRDRESELRVERHRQMRAERCFRTLECPKALSSAPIPRNAAVLLEDLPNLLANEMFEGGEPDNVLRDLRNLSRQCCHLCMVTGEVFSDGIRYDSLTQTYIARLAQLNRSLAAACDCTIEVICGIPVLLRGTLPFPL